MSDQWSFWRASLEGKAPPVREGDLEAGYYRTDKYEPVGIWTQNGEWLARKGKQTLDDEIDIAELFMKVAGNPITFELYTDVTEGKPWPHDPKPTKAKEDAKPAPSPIGDNKPPTEFEAFKDELRDWREVMKSLTAKPVADQETADKIANIKKTIDGIDKQVTNLFKAEKAPILDAERAVAIKFRPLQDMAAEIKKLASDALTPYQIAQREASRKLAETAKAAGVSVDAEKPKAGTGGKGMNLRTLKRAKINDLAAVALFFAQMGNPPEELVTVCRTLAQRVMTNGVAVPGAELVEVTTSV